VGLLRSRNSISLTASLSVLLHPSIAPESNRNCVQVVLQVGCGESHELFGDVPSTIDTRSIPRDGVSLKISRGVKEDAPSIRRSSPPFVYTPADGAKANDETSV
jgi:hypothetical protein